MKVFHCDSCRQILYFENTHCLACGSILGFLPDFQVISSLQAGSGGEWTALAPKAGRRLYRKCANYEVEEVCNWMVPVEDPNPHCAACRLNSMIPNLAKPGNRLYWYRLEVAKRRLIYNLSKLNLPVVGRDADPDQGLAFRFLEDEEVNFKETKRVMTGHANGIITINIAEADDALRVRMRLEMKEEYRTLIGHYRHEIGHYYWKRLIELTCFHEPFRTIFGDERIDYNEALRSHYTRAGVVSWQENYVSAYASSHPWEDWAETWAHYLHMVDTLETAQSWGLSLSPRDDEHEPVGQHAHQSYFIDNRWANFDSLYAKWQWLTCAINSMNRSMGQRDFYPFTLSGNAVKKLRFVDTVIKAQ